MTVPPPRQSSEFSEPTHASPLLTVEQAAEYLNVGRSTMYGLIRDGDVESIHIGRLRRIPLDALPAYLTRLRQSESIARERLNA